MNPTTSTIGVVTGPEQAASMLHPTRRRILESLREPASASSLAPHLGLPRQKVNYHLRALERHGLVTLVEERRKGNCTERILRTTARYWVIAPEAVGALAADPDKIRDRFSSAYLTALAARTVSDLGDLRVRADREGKKLATFSLETEVRFATAEARAAFAQELADQVTALVRKYNVEPSETARAFRLVVGSYPVARRRRSDTGKADDPHHNDEGGSTS